MVHSWGLKARTRHLFQKKFRKHGVPSVSRNANVFKVGQYIDVVGDPSVRRGLPHKKVHGRTGVCVGVTPRGVTVMVNRKHRNRTLRKRFCLRHEHCRPSKCRDAFVKKQKAFAEHQAAVKAGKKCAAKKTSNRAAKTVRPAKVVDLARTKLDYDHYFDY